MISFSFVKSSNVFYSKFTVYIFFAIYLRSGRYSLFLYVFALKNDFHVLHNEYIIHSYFKYSRHYATKAYTSQLH